MGRRLSLNDATSSPPQTGRDRWSRAVIGTQLARTQPCSTARQSVRRPTSARFLPVLQRVLVLERRSPLVDRAGDVQFVRGAARPPRGRGPLREETAPRSRGPRRYPIRRRFRSGRATPRPARPTPPSAPSPPAAPAGIELDRQPAQGEALGVLALPVVVAVGDLLEVLKRRPRGLAKLADRRRGGSHACRSRRRRPSSAPPTRSAAVSSIWRASR